MPHNEDDFAELPPVVRGFIDRHRIPRSALRPGGRVVLTVDKRYLVSLFSAPHNRVCLQANLFTLDEKPGSRSDEILWRLSCAAAGLAKNSTSTLCIDRKRQTLALQSQIAATAPVEALQDTLTDFTNALAFWTRMCSPQNAGALPR